MFKKIIISLLIMSLSACINLRSNQEREIQCNKMGFNKKNDPNGACMLYLIDQDYKENKRIARFFADDGSEKTIDPHYSQCIGPIIMGKCRGSIVPSSTYHRVCHGTILNGQCTGPAF